jgi:hypothetical protein
VSPDVNPSYRRAQKDPERLERWLEKAVVASSVVAVLDLFPTAGRERGHEAGRSVSGRPARYARSR